MLIKIGEEYIIKIKMFVFKRIREKINMRVKIDEK